MSNRSRASQRPTICPHCQQEILHIERFGVRIPYLKAQIIDLVRASGDIGISSREIRDTLDVDRATPRAANSIKAHVLQINILLAETDYSVVSSCRGVHARWHLRKARQRVVA